MRQQLPLVPRGRDELLGLLKVLLDDVARGDVATLGGELQHELAAHARSATRDHRDTAGEAVLEPC